MTRLAALGVVWVVVVLALSAGGGAAVGPAVPSVAYLEQQQQADGGFAEQSAVADATLTAWAALALVAGDGSERSRAQALVYLRAHETAVSTDTDAALQALARAALGDRPQALLSRLRSYRPGKLVNATIWTALALRQAGEPVPTALVRSLRRAQDVKGGWSWSRGGGPDSNDTAAAVEALRASGVSGRPVVRALAYLARCRNRDGGYGLIPRRGSDAQSTAWAIQALLAARVRPRPTAYRFLAGLRRPDGSFRYSARYATTPVWVTAQVVPALARRAFPLRVDS